MSRFHTINRPAGAAIAAVLMLAATPLAAQEVIAPEAEAPVAPPAEPVIALEPPAAVADPEPIASEAVEAAPVVAAPIARRATPRATVRSQPAAPAAAAVAPVAVAPSAVPVAPEPVAPVAVEPLPVAPPSAAPAPSAEYDVDNSLLAGLLAALGLGGVALLVARSRRRRRDAYVETYDEPVIVEPVAEPVAAAAPEPAYATAAPSPFTPPVLAAAPVLVGPLPETLEERRELVSRMVAAEPDKANPFRSRKARRRRARLMIQQHERRQAKRERLAGSSRYDWEAFRASAASQPARETEPA